MPGMYRIPVTGGQNLGKLNRENARKATDESVKRYQQCKTLSVIDGMPIGIKDVLQTRDMPPELSSPICKGH